MGFFLFFTDRFLQASFYIFVLLLPNQIYSELVEFECVFDIYLVFISFILV